MKIHENASGYALYAYPDRFDIRRPNSDVYTEKDLFKALQRYASTFTADDPFPFSVEITVVHEWDNGYQLVCSNFGFTISHNSVDGSLIHKEPYHWEAMPEAWEAFKSYEKLPIGNQDWVGGNESG